MVAIDYSDSRVELGRWFLIVSVRRTWELLLSMFFGGAVVLCNSQRRPAKVSRIVVWGFGLEGGNYYLQRGIA